MTTISEKLTQINTAKQAIKTAIGERGVSMEGVAFPAYADKIREIPAGGGGGEGGGGETARQYTGHADVEGLKAIGWDDDDIAFFQQYGVFWDEEDDDLYKVPDYDKSRYGEISENNLAVTANTYITYLPKIKITKTQIYLSGYNRLIGIPILDTKSLTNISNSFTQLYQLRAFPPLDFSNVKSAGSAFQYCSNLRYIGKINLSQCTSLQSLFQYCYSLQSVDNVVMPNNITNIKNLYSDCAALARTHKFSAPITNIDSFISKCYSLVCIEEMDVSQVTSFSSVFNYSSALRIAKLKNLKATIDLSACRGFSKEGLLYLINNEAATSAITITLYSSVYTFLSEDADVLAALANHPKVSLAK